MSAPLKVGTSFEVGDWLAWTAVVAKVERLVPNDGVVVYAMSNGGMWPSRQPGIVKVRVTFPKPKRKLTLSAGLAWLKTKPDLALSSDGQEWGIWDVDGMHWVASDCAVYTSPLKAIIAARKALGVKS